MGRTDAVLRALEAAQTIGKELGPGFAVRQGEGEWITLEGLAKLLTFRGSCTLCLAVATQGGNLLLSPLMALGKDAPLPGVQG